MKVQVQKPDLKTVAEQAHRGVDELLALQAKVDVEIQQVKSQLDKIRQVVGNGVVKLAPRLERVVTPEQEKPAKVVKYAKKPKENKEPKKAKEPALPSTASLADWARKATENVTEAQTPNQIGVAVLKLGYEDQSKNVESFVQQILREGITALVAENYLKEVTEDGVVKYQRVS